jgi:hypothetical protein
MNQQGEYGILSAAFFGQTRCNGITSSDLLSSLASSGSRLI